MDNQNFGIFITTLRKEKGWTQRELADKLNVTDKAISKWERGLGFPDIKMLEPLAKALDVSLLEIMHSERIQEQEVATECAEEAISDVIDVLSYQRKIERRNIFIGIMSVISLILIIFLVDAMELVGFIMVCLPIIFLAIGVLLILISWKKYKEHSTYLTFLILGIFALLFPLLLCLLLYFAYILGGPIPN